MVFGVWQNVCVLGVFDDTFVIASSPLRALFICFKFTYGSISFFVQSASAIFSLLCIIIIVAIVANIVVIIVINLSLLPFAI